MNRKNVVVLFNSFVLSCSWFLSSYSRKTDCEEEVYQYIAHTLLRFSNFVFPARLVIVLYLISWEKKLGFTQLHLPAHQSNMKDESKALWETFIRFPVGVFEIFPLIFVDLFINCLKKNLSIWKELLTAQKWYWCFLTFLLFHTQNMF